MLAPALLTTERCRLDGLRPIIDSWRRLASAAIEPNVFYDPAFALPAAAQFGSDVETILVWQTGAARRLVGLFPFETATWRYGVPIPVLVGWTHPFAPWGTPLIDRELCDSVVAAFLDRVTMGDRPAKFIVLPFIAETGPVAGALRRALGETGGAAAAFGCHRRAALVSEGGTDYIVRALSGKRRKEWRRQRRRLGDVGPVTFSLASAPAEVEVALREFLALEACGWKGRAGTAIAQNAGVRHFVETAIAALADRGEVRLAKLACGPHPVACVLTLISGSAAWCWKIAYDERYSGASPGVQIMLDLTEALLADKAITSVDSCAVPGHPMIGHLWREHIAIGDWLVAPRPQPAFALACALEGARHRGLALARVLRDRFARPRIPERRLRSD